MGSHLLSTFQYVDGPIPMPAAIAFANDDSLNEYNSVANPHRLTLRHDGVDSAGTEITSMVLVIVHHLLTS